MIIDPVPTQLELERVRRRARVRTISYAVFGAIFIALGIIDFRLPRAGLRAWGTILIGVGWLGVAYREWKRFKE